MARVIFAAGLDNKWFYYPISIIIDKGNCLQIFFRFFVYTFFEARL
jgi:hypothetical protein